MTTQSRLQYALHLGIIALGLSLGPAAAQDITAGMGQGGGASASDQATEARLITAYSLNPHLNAASIAVQAHDGVVTLVGKVNDERDRKLALRLARDLPGVTRVQDRLEIGAGLAPAPTDDLNDADTTAMVQGRLLENEYTSHSQIKVATKGAVVTLEGRVGSEEARRVAQRLARSTVGVRSVINDLKVTSGHMSRH